MRAKRNMNYEIKHKLEKDYLRQMLKLDINNYNKDDQGLYDTCMSWYLKNNDIYTILLDEKKKVIGYINFVPLTPDSYELFRKGKIYDMELTQNNILPYSSNSKVSCLLMSIVIQTEYRDTEVVKILTKALYEKLDNISKEKNVKIERILADCVSADGVKYVSYQGFQKIMDTKRNTVLYEKVLE